MILGKASTIEWAKIKGEYVTGDKSLYKLSQDYDVDYSTIKNKSAKEGWGKEKEDRKNGTYVEKPKEVIPPVTRGATIDRAARKTLFLLDRILKYAENEHPLDTINICKMSAQTLKDLKDIRGSALDMKEQEARIKKIEKDLATDNNKTVTVEFSGDLTDLSK